MILKTDKKVICFSCIQITYSYIFYYFTRHDILKYIRGAQFYLFYLLATDTALYVNGG